MSKNLESILFGKVPPQAKEIEQDILGTMLFYPEIIYIAKETLNRDDFYVASHGLIYDAIIETSAHGSTDLMLVVQRLKDIGEIENAGGHFYLTSLLSKTTNNTHVKRKCLIIKQKSVQRKLIDFAAKVLTNAYEETDDVFNLLTDSAEILKTINADLDELSIVSNVEIGMKLLEMFDERVYKAKNDIPDESAVYTGIKEWDEINGSLFPGLYIVAGRPGMGKGVHLTELICRMAKTVPLGVINGEMTDEQLMKRVGCNIKGIDNSLFKKDPKTVTELEQDILHDAINEAVNLKFFIENSRKINKIANRIRMWVKHNGVKCILADFLTLFKAPAELRKYFSKTQEVDYILEVFTELCKELNVPIILYAQMNREILGRHGVKEPNLADLKQSGSIEELAFQVSFLHRPEYYDEKAVTDEFGEDTKGLMYQIIAKHRDGKTNCRMKMKADLAKSRLRDWDNNLYVQDGGMITDLPF